MLKSVDRAAQAMGYPEAAKSYEALQALGGDLRKTVSGRASALAIDLARTPWPAAGSRGVCGHPPPVSRCGIQSGIGPFVAWIDPAGRRVAEVSTFVFGLVAWLRVVVGRGLGLITSIEEGLEKAHQARQKKIATDDTVKKANQELVRAQTEEQAARDNLRKAEAERQRLQTELQELRPERKLFRLLEDRSRSGAYSQHLGIISLIRTDFEADQQPP